MGNNASHKVHICVEFFLMNFKKLFHEALWIQLGDVSFHFFQMPTRVKLIIFFWDIFFYSEIKMKPSKLILDPVLLYIFVVGCWNST